MLVWRGMALVHDYEELGDGHHDILWDGTDEAGQVVVPGAYLYRVSVDGDDGIVTRQGVLGVVY